MHKMLKYRVPKVEQKKGRVFSYMMFFYSFAMALIGPVFPEYLEEITGSTEYVGLLLSLAAFVALFAGIVISRFLHRISRFRLLYSGFLGMAMVFLLYYLSGSTAMLGIAQVLKGAFAASMFVVIPLMVRDYTDEKSLSHEEGIYYWFLNLAWILGPLTGGVVAMYFGAESVFLISMFITLFAVWFLGHKHVIEISNKSNEEQGSLVKNLKRFFGNIHFVKAYLVDFGLYIWWSISTMVIPLYLYFNGFSPIVVGAVMAGKLIPLLLLEKTIGDNLGDGKLGKSVMKGFSIMIISMVLLVIVNNVYFSIAMFFFIVLGAAFIEPVKETYLFRHMRKDQEDALFPIYSTARQVGFLIGPLFAGIIIASFGYQVLYLVLASCLLPMVFVGYLIYKE